jgi:VWFA-related protein
MRKVLALLLLGPVAATPAQRPSPEDVPQSSAVFKAATKLVEVDVVARNKRGPAAGRSREDFTLFDNAKPQEIAFFTVRSVRGLAGSNALPSALPLPPGVVSNRPNPGGDAPSTQTIVLLDQLFTSPVNQIVAIRRIDKFLDLRRKQDGIGIFTLGAGVNVVQDMTTDDTLLRRAVKRLQGRDASFRRVTTNSARHEMSPSATRRRIALRGMLLVRPDCLPSVSLPAFREEFQIDSIGQRLVPCIGRVGMVAAIERRQDL